MLNAILFNDPEKFDFNDDNNYMDTITNNCIVICEDTGIKNFLAKQIEDIFGGKHEHEDGYIYYTDEHREVNITSRISYLPTTHFIINNEQKITFTIEAPFVLTATSVEDIWFACRTNDNKVSIYPLKVFKGHKEDWDIGVFEIYKNVISGRYGTYSFGNVSNVPINGEEV